MDTSKISAPHETRLLRVIDHIYKHIAGDLSLDTLSDVAAMSRFHWHRTYKGIAGETIGETIRRVRLNNAARELVQSQEPVATIAQRCGYPNRRSFERAFLEAYHLTPAEFRRRGTARPQVGPYHHRPVIEVALVERAPQVIATLIHAGRYEESAPTMHRLLALCAARGVRRIAPPVGVFIESGSGIPQHLRRALVGLPVEPSAQVSVPLRPFTIRGGRYAVGSYVGPSAGLPKAWDWFCRECSSRFGDYLVKGPCFEEYCDDPSEVVPSALLTKMYLPLARGF
ncbi:AraC family transcriptional regulator [Devosia nitrariae]|uniref:HTH araC/xylS-type domain-containing protein n=1 Tax=Devosia nitrariae TaxID=2071872 RepID=A0ABQ5W1N3_9HYPH|nr:AraC family transcriptional regulator [Devosia nitrariae]GLQ53779.1 hypothetical protein GCM10010862_10380 [Devosia nitrariae]